MPRLTSSPFIRQYAVLFVLLGATLAVIPARADTASDLAFTAFPTANPNSLAGGQVLQARGGLIEFQRGITAQSLYLIDAPVQAVQAKLTTWNPANHSELKVWMHNALPAKPALTDFGGLSTLPDNSSVKYLLKATQTLNPSNPALQVNKEEAALIASMASSQSDPKALLVGAWSQIMLGRIDRFLSGNFRGDDYTASDGNIGSLSEITSLLRSNPKVYARFHPLLVQTPIYNTNKAIPVNLYYECFDIEGGAVLGTGAVYESQVNGGAATGPSVPADGALLSADIEYFVNNGIYVSLELHQLSPVNINGRTETLMWRDDLVSTSNIAYLHGTERLASGMIMLQDVKQAVDAFRAEFK